jgi:hypothetical protein
MEGETETKTGGESGSAGASNSAHVLVRGRAVSMSAPTWSSMPVGQVSAAPATVTVAVPVPVPMPVPVRVPVAV